MKKQFISMDQRLYDHMLSVSLKESEALRSLREETARDPMAILQISADQGQLMALLVKLVGARRVLEIGTYTGYSALWMATALPEDGELIACDVNEEWTNIAQRHWQQSDAGQKIELRLAPAVETMEALLADGQEGSFDVVFIDADKGNYRNYFELGLQLLRTGGLMLVDNTLWKGRIADDSEQDADTCAIREMNALIFNDARVDSSIIPIADGLTMALKK